nr:MmpS family transport accessory protein [Nocardia ignorata]
MSKSIDAAASSINSTTPTTPDSPGAPIPPLTAGSSTGKGKNITYEIVSDAAELNSVTYFDGNSELQQEVSAAAPWTKSVTNDSTVSIIGLGARPTAHRSRAESPWTARSLTNRPRPENTQ